MNSFFTWWHYLPYHIDPVILNLGSFQLRYYGLMYIIAFSMAYYLMNFRNKQEKLGYTKTQLENFIFWIIIFVLLGGRFGYVLFYNFKHFLHNPLEIIMPFKFENGVEFTGISGMSYHGAVIGAVIGALTFCKKEKINFWKLADFVIPCVPLGYTFGRFGNFFNGELYGRTTDFVFGMYFPLAEYHDQTKILRHPSQLYEAFSEGVMLFLILWAFRKKEVLKGKFLGLYILGYGVIRFMIEYVREPDAHLGFIWFNLSMGQLLCLAMIVSGFILMFIPKKLWNR